MINIEVFGQLVKDESRQLAMEYSEPVRVREIAHMLGIDVDMVGLLTIDGCNVDFDNIVKNDCRLCFFPFMQGG